MGSTFQEIRKAIIEGDAQAAKEFSQTALKEGYGTETIIMEALFPPMKELSELLGTGEIFIPQVLLSARAMHAAMYSLKPVVSHYDGHRKGLVVIGTVAGDLHDIGKNLVAMVMSGSGFEVIDLGIDVTREEFIKAVKRYQPDILAMSALLTTTMPELQNVIEGVVEEGLRPQVSIMVGGCPVTEEYAREIKADRYSDTMFDAVRAAEDIMDQRKKAVVL